MCQSHSWLSGRYWHMSLCGRVFESQNWLRSFAGIWFPFGQHIAGHQVLAWATFSLLRLVQNRKINTSTYIQIQAYTSKFKQIHTDTSRYILIRAHTYAIQVIHADTITYMYIHTDVCMCMYCMYLSVLYEYVCIVCIACICLYCMYKFVLFVLCVWCVSVWIRMYCMYWMYCMYVYVLSVYVYISWIFFADTYTYIHIHTYIQYKQNTDMWKMYVCVCIFGWIHTLYIQPVLHTYTYRHAGSLMFDLIRFSSCTALALSGTESSLSYSMERTTVSAQTRVFIQIRSPVCPVPPK